MKKFLIICLSIVLIMTFVPLNALAHTPVATTTLQQLDSIPDISHLISLDLPSSQVYSYPGASDELSDADLADLADIRYGISLIGVKKSLQRPVGAASDGVWSNYNKGGTVLQNGMWSNGTITWMTPEDTYYNVKGEIGATDSIYVSLLTYNFGKVMNLEAFGYFTNNFNAFPRAADLYASNDGVEWTIIGKYDGNQIRVDGSEFTSAAATSPEDSLGGTTSTNPLWSLEGTSAQYLRIAIVKGCGTQASGNPDNLYDKWSSKTSSVSIATREIVVFGTDPDPENPPVFEPVTPSEGNESESDENGGSQETPNAGNPSQDSDKQTTAKPQTTNAPETTAAPDENTTADTDATDDKKGCASSLGYSTAIAMITVMGFTMVGLRKRRGQVR